MEGTFIVLEGPDGSGTTRHSTMLAENLRTLGKTVVLTAEPTDSPIGKEIRAVLKSDNMPSPGAVQLLFCADRANHVSTVIAPALLRGDMVICDRYVLSTLIYGAATGLSREWLLAVNAVFPKPDLSIIALPPFDVCMERILKRTERDRFETENFQRRVYEGYRNTEDTESMFIDTSGDKDEVADCILRRVLSHIDERSRVERIV